MAQAADFDSYRGWDGLYIGWHVGYGHLDSDNTAVGQSWNQDAGGIVGGVFVGYNMELDNIVLGIELDTEFGDMIGSTTIAGLGDVRFAFHGQHTARIRTGWNVGPGLLYATGGLAMSDLWLKALPTTEKRFLWGGVVGAGFETKLTEGVTARAEYLYANYGKQTYQLASPVTVDYQTHSARIGIGWLF
jgi:outer membrane immunogenic protein